ncbi:MAG: phosphoglycerate mutase family protein [Melioribacteraceae bacterium]|nr:phosphoglycerate mutase family protein [Melioribacteraceae bacterium]MCF8265161.1 phosphoglycerate mutase family protein [Melioribacteraceae bacterium]MCF8413239.1 phosphoglycerate mutase family protein [Melioribacteraceae bacterium]
MNNLGLKILLGVVSFLLIISCEKEKKESFAGTELYFVRHAESVANATGISSEENNRSFSERGKKQIDSLNILIENKIFDLIVTSPKWRAQNTILPFLKISNQKAEIWPEFAECCWQDDRSESNMSKIPIGEEFEISDPEYLSARDAESIFEYSTSDSYSNGINQIRKGVELLRNKYFNKGMKILIVGHSYSGANLLKILLNKDLDSELKLKNAKLNFLREKNENEFELVYQNRGLK